MGLHHSGDVADAGGSHRLARGIVALRRLGLEAGLSFVAGAAGALLSSGIFAAFEEILSRMDERFFTSYPGPYVVGSITVGVILAWIVVIWKSIIFPAVAAAFAFACAALAGASLLYTDVVRDDIYVRFLLSFVALLFVGTAALVSVACLILRSFDWQVRPRPEILAVSASGTDMLQQNVERDKTGESEEAADEHGEERRLQ